MSLFNLPWLPESIKKRALRYLLQRYLGHFLLEKINLDQLSIDLYNGKGAITEIFLDVASINAMMEKVACLPFKFIDGSIDELSVDVPWSTLTTDSCTVHFEGIVLNICQVIDRKRGCIDVRDSELISKSLMTSSMQIAEEIVNEEQPLNKFEGLEMFAQLIDSVLRRFKLSASNTSIKILAPRKTGDGQEMEIRIKHMTCLEEELEMDNNDGKNKVNHVSEDIKKIITLEGVEIFINDVLICKLNGKHSIRIKIDEIETDVQMFFGSHIFAILTAKQLETVMEFFDCGDHMQMEPITNDKLMNEEDYMRVEQQLQLDAGYNKMINNTVISPTSITLDSNKWTSCGLIEDEPKFLPLENFIDDNNKSRKKQENPKTRSRYSCQVKIPGLVVSVISSDHQTMPEFNGLPLMNNHDLFYSFNSFLDEILHGFNHIRFLTLHLLLDITTDSLSFSCGDFIVSEVIDNSLNKLLWNENSVKLIESPLMRFKLKDNSLFFTLSSTCVRLDPTFLERYHKYFSASSKTNSSQTDFNYNIEANFDSLRVELLFPIPDLRPDCERERVSRLRSESLIAKLVQPSFHWSSSSGEVNCKQLSFDLKISNTLTNLLVARAIDTDLILLKFFIGVNNSINTTFNDMELFDADMEDSIYISQAVPQQVTEPFQVKRKVIGREGDEENEQVITPGDRDHLNKFLSSSASCAQMFFELHVPTVDVNFKSKEHFELIYNRIGNDLVFWTPVTDILMQANIIKEPLPANPRFYSCKAALTDSCESNSSFHSLLASSPNPCSNFLTFIFYINDITFSIQTEDENKMSIFGQNVMVGIVSGGKEVKNSAICLCGENILLKSNDTTLISGNIYSEPNCQLSLAVDICRESEILKKIKLAIQLSCAAMYEINIPVFEQFWSFINVEDELIVGYIPPKVIIELHLDVVGSAITLENLTNRPALISFEDIYLTSMVVENTNQTLLRIFAEETLLCLKRNKAGAEAMKNYICVVQSGIIDLNIKFSKDGRLVFKLSNNAIDIRACSDSLSALIQMISALTSSSSSSSSTDNDNIVKDTIEPQDNFDGNLIADAMGDIYDDPYDNADSDDEPPKFCSADFDSSKIDESGFWILGDDDLGAGIKMTSEPQIRVLVSEPVKVVENHFSISRYRVIPDILPATLARYLLEEMTLILHLFDGRDFDDELSSNDSCGEKRADDVKVKKYLSQNEPRVRFADGSVHIWENIDLVSTPANTGQNYGTSSTFKITGGSKRQYETCVELYLAKVKVLFENFDDTFPIAWRFLFMVQDIEIIDRVVASKIKKMLYEYSSESMPRRKHTNMVSVRVASYRNNSENCQESDLKISIKPLRVNLDQDTIMFLSDFFATVIATLDSEETILANSPNYNQVINPPDYCDTDFDTQSVQSCDTEVSSNSSNKRNVSNFAGSSKSNKVFFKSFVFSPDVPIRLDYHGKHVDFDKGALAGLLLGLAQLNQSELRLKRLSNKHGILGIDKVFAYAIKEWANDIKRSQLPSLLGGVGPMHSFIQLFQGFKDLIWMPIDQYRRDRRLVRGLQRGASSFSTSTAMATLDLANRFVNLIQSAAQFAHDVVTPPNPVLRQASLITMCTQPRDFREGMAVGIARVKEDFQVIGKELGTAAMSDDVLGELVRKLPSIAVKPLITATHATSNVIVGMRNQLTPEARKDDHDKYKNAADR